MLTTKLTEKDGWVLIPVYGAVVAGDPNENYILEDTYEPVRDEVLAKGDCFAAKVWGDSMEPEMKEGDVVIVRSQHDCKNGQVAIVSVNGAKATIKRVYKDTKTCRLVPVNESYSPQIYESCDDTQYDIKIMGVVIELRKKYIKNRYVK